MLASVLAASVRRDGSHRPTPAEALHRVLAVPAPVAGVVVPDLVGQPRAAAEVFVATVPSARLSVGGDGPVIAYQHPTAGATIAPGGQLAVTLGSEASAALARDARSPAAAASRQQVGAQHPVPTAVSITPVAPRADRHEVRDPGSSGPTAPASYPSFVVVVTYEAPAPEGDQWSWRLVDGSSATTVGVVPVSDGEGCASVGHQRLAAPFARPVPPDHEVTVRLERRVGRGDEVVTASTMTAASTYRGRGLVLRTEDGRLATSPTGGARC